MSAFPGLSTWCAERRAGMRAGSLFRMIFRNRCAPDCISWRHCIEAAALTDAVTNFATHVRSSVGWQRRSRDRLCLRLPHRQDTPDGPVRVRLYDTGQVMCASQTGLASPRRRRANNPAAAMPNRETVPGSGTLAPGAPTIVPPLMLHPAQAIVSAAPLAPSRSTTP